MRLKRFKGVATVVLSLLCLSLIANGGLYMWLQTVRSRNLRMDKELASLTAMKSGWQKQKEILWARLVAAEAPATGDSVKPTDAGDGQPMSAEDAGHPPNPQDTGNRAAAAATPPDAPEEAAEEGAAGQNESPNSPVAVEDFEASHDPRANVLSVKYRIKNSDPSGATVSGQTLVLLKPEGAAPDQWVSIPGIGLKDGEPAGEKMGQAFSIARFMIIRMKASGISDPKRYDTATVKVYGHDRSLMLDKDFALDLQ